MSEEKQTAEQVEAAEQEEVTEQAEQAASQEQHEETAGQEEALQHQIDELQGLLDEKENKLLRVQADFENYKRRSRLEMEAAQKYRSQNVVTEILPALDNFERALQVEAESEQTKSLLQGMEMVRRQLMDALEKEGVEAIEAVGQEFDPNLHQAVMQVEDENFGSNIVIEELQKGYKLKDRVIRPSMVKVNQ
ncbi:MULTISPECIES: nucleotide exchange factor GrpE [Bacillus]|jgi:molecular chaperone GrpE|uniref:Protein GrpE n=3 Tax=Bacillus velezensis TaxID=492670 RepID=GRPE_BACVZ|nr:MULTISPECIES: nucleotide exchange factor GrpE [Bacillus]A7Z6W2.1 RecName: Full=Protein GrpE; AltName: Full=HSP-70 cofactor [Bacillus velezensis FZB42]AIU78170.1 heat shock protein GrpE [Bacillus subtilis]ARM28538.1 nucleotide exchange factor GrpE [Bacillus vallismortis]UXZ16668.1 nucleotide exchange factor GrpE [Bacillus siamensis]COC64520.1 heat shock protein%2C chaperonin [Streptococcus pneumoniae]SLB13080.1 heat shock protein GrpE [Mycobacteroides abscessus subsp. massiliense]